MGATYQVIEENGKKGIAPITESVTVDSSDLESKIAAAQSTADTAKSKADAALPKTEAASTYATKTELNRDFLPKSGGTLTGDLGIDSGGVYPLTLFYRINAGGGDVDVSTICDIRFVGSDNIRVSQIRSTLDTDGKRSISLQVCNTSNALVTEAVLVAEADGSNPVFTAPIHNTPEYGKIVVTEQAMQNYAPKKLTTPTNFHVNADTGSDTADLFNGRGLSEDKPFKTLEACISHILYNYSGHAAVVVLHSDVDFRGLTWQINGPSYIKVTSDSIKRTINHTGTTYVFKINDGEFTVENIIINANPVSCTTFLFCDGGFGGNPKICIGSDVKFNGAVTDATCCAWWGGKILTRRSIGGTVTGKRYSALHSSRIMVTGQGAEAIPGTEAGTCDESSTYA